MSKKIDYKMSINKAMRKRTRGKYDRYLLIAGVAVIVILLSVIIGKTWNRPAVLILTSWRLPIF